MIEVALRQAQMDQEVENSHEGGRRGVYVRVVTPCRRLPLPRPLRQSKSQAWRKK